MKKILIFSMALTIITFYPSYAAGKNSYKSQIEKKMDAFEKKVEAKYPENEENDFEYRQYISEIHDEWDKELNIVYKKIIDIMNKSEGYDNAKKHLIQAQKDWIKFRDSSGDFKYYLVAGDFGGTMGINPQISEMARIVKERTLHLSEIYDLLTGY